MYVYTYIHKWVYIYIYCSLVSETSTLNCVVLVGSKF